MSQDETSPPCLCIAQACKELVQRPRHKEELVHVLRRVHLQFFSNAEAEHEAVLWWNLKMRAWEP
jgi:hypothetical protein